LRLIQTIIKCASGVRPCSKARLLLFVVEYSKISNIDFTRISHRAGTGMEKNERQNKKQKGSGSYKGIALYM
jgi:hypothetical protein